MPTTVPALVTEGAAHPLERRTVDRRDPRPRDVVIDIAYAGICHSDIHQARDEWGGSEFPMVPGHEIAGTVSEVGSEVTTYSVGDRVGVGCLVDSCRECENCRAGEEQFCTRGSVQTYNGREYTGEQTFGGYSTQVVVDEHFVLGIPEGIGLDQAAPLLCAGITLYTPLTHWKAGPGTKVAIVGMGGLGHMGVKIAHALGAEGYYATSDANTFTELASSFDLIVNTVSADMDIEQYLNLLRVDGTMVNVGVPVSPASVHAFTLAMGRRSLAGSAIGGIRDTQKMLDFCAEHHLGAEIETITVDDVNKAYDRVVDSDVRYRFVIDIASFG